MVWPSHFPRLLTLQIFITLFTTNTLTLFFYLPLARIIPTLTSPVVLRYLRPIMQFSAPSFVTLAVLALSSGAAAVCSGSSIAIGSIATATTSGYSQCQSLLSTLTHLSTHHAFFLCSSLTVPATTDTIYNTGCTVKTTNVFLTAAGVCDNQDFLCTPGTKTIAEYDDPTSGWAYTCKADTTSETCSSDTITYCVSNSLPAITNNRPNLFSSLTLASLQQCSPK